MPVRFTGAKDQPAIDCSGSLATDLNAWIASGAHPWFGRWITVFIQSGSRDFTLPTGALHSDAAAFVVGP